MDRGAQNDPGTIQTKLVRVIKDFSYYLSQLKKTHHTFPDISKNSHDLINQWGSKTRSLPLFFFEGPENAQVFIIDSQGNFFKGESGALFIKILSAMNLSSDSVFICNADDLESVDKKIKTIAPQVIIALGTKAAQSILNIKLPLEKFRGKFHEYKDTQVMPTFHPSLLLKQPEYKRQVWEDMKKVMDYLGLKNGP